MLNPNYGIHTKGTVFWITGLSGSGKTTISRLFFQRLREKKTNVILLDGDELRSIWGVEGAYHYEERKKLSLSYCRLSKLLSDQGFDVVIATISLFSECHIWNRKNLPNYFEIFLSVPLEELKKRNQKNLFSKGVQQVVGIDISFDVPLAPDIVLDNSGHLTPEELEMQLYKQTRI